MWTSTARFTNRKSYWLTLWGDFENLGDDVASFEPAMAIEEAGVAYVNRTGDPPRLLPGTTALGKLTFLIPEDLDMDSAEFVVGANTESRARIPLGSSGSADRLEPEGVEISGRLATDLVAFDFTSGLLRYDLPGAHRQLDSGKIALTVYFDVTSRVPGDHRALADEMVLVVPDGSTITPTKTELGEVPGDPEGVVTPDRSVTFVIDEVPTGDFTIHLVLDEAFVVEEGVAETTFGFSL